MAVGITHMKSALLLAFVKAANRESVRKTERELGEREMNTRTQMYFNVFAEVVSSLVTMQVDAFANTR